MILGDCPYDCGEPMLLPIAGYGDQFERHECEGCGRVIWTHHSRIDPWSMTEADFLAAYDVDAETGQVLKRGPTP
jgi:hypothetical protein